MPIISPQIAPKIAIKKLNCDNFTPISVLPNAEVLLESAVAQTGRERYSMMILSSAFRVRKVNGKYIFSDNAQNVELNALDENKKFLDWIDYFRALAPKSEIDFPLPLGGMGYLGYEFFSEIEEMRFEKPRLMGIPECCFVFGRDFLIFDHLYDVAIACSVNYACDSEKIDIEGRLRAIEEMLSKIPPKPHDSTEYGVEIISPSKREEYTRNVEIIKGEIYKGNLLQCVPSQSMQIRSTLPPLQAYANLRRANPSPYMFYFKCDDFVLFGASPEVMIKLQDSKLTIRPIAGTRHRGENLAADNALEKELLSDEKENAEHLMLVDLARNDIGKISRAGSVEVVKSRVIEKYSSVMHLVSEVQGTIAPKLDFRDAIYATFPAGTVSGAPKIAAIKMIESLESHARETYSGMIAYISQNGNLDSAISIRSAVHKGGIYYLQAGSGIVYDSKPEVEYQETENKMKALIECITKAKL